MSETDANTNPFQKMMNEITKKFAEISVSIANSEKNLNEKITTSEQKVIDHIDVKYNELSEQIVKLEERISVIESEATSQSEKITELQLESAAKSSYIAELEMRINKCNLILYNFEETEITPEELLTNLIKFFNNVMKVILKHSDIDVAYRIGKEQPRKIRPVFISLTTIKMRDYIFSCRRNLKDSKASISEDCPNEILERRKQLLPALLGAKKLKNKAFFKYGTLMVNGVTCSEEDIEKYSKSHAESQKRPRSSEVTSPSNITQEKKKPKGFSSVNRNIGRQRSLSLSQSPNPSTSKQITQFFNPSTSSSQNSQTFFIQSEK